MIPQELVRLLKAQMLFIAVVGGVFLVISGTSALLAALYGGFVALSYSIMLGGNVQRAREHAAKDANRDVAILMFGAVQRFLFVPVAIGLGIGLVGLTPIPMIVTFAASFLVQILVSLGQARVNR